MAGGTFSTIKESCQRLAVLLLAALGDKQHHQSDDAQASHSQHHPQGGHVAAVAGGGGIRRGGLRRLSGLLRRGRLAGIAGLAGFHRRGRLLSAAAAALAILVVVTQSGNHLALLHRDAADLADLVAGVAVLGAGGILGTHQLRVVIGGGDDLGLGIGVLLALKSDLGGVGPNAIDLAGGLGGHLRGRWPSRSSHGKYH